MPQFRKKPRAPRYRPPSIKESALPRIVQRIIAATLFLLLVTIVSTRDRTATRRPTTC